jgi:hypothetical protein
MGRWLLLVSLLLAAPACVFPVVVRHSMTGSVVDARTGEPLADAQVCVEDWRVYQPSLSPAELDGSVLVSTDTGGRYSIPGRREWHFVFPFGSEGVPVWLPRLTTAHEGYASQTINGWEEVRSPERIATDPVRLEPLNGGSGVITCPLSREVRDLPPPPPEPPGPVWRGPANTAEECVGAFEPQARVCAPPRPKIEALDSEPAEGP